MSRRALRLPLVPLRTVATLIAALAVASWSGATQEGSAYAGAVVTAPPAAPSPSPSPSASPGSQTRAASPSGGGVLQTVSAPPNPAGGPNPTPNPFPGCDPYGQSSGPDCPAPHKPVTCDFEGDGKGDLAVGVPGEDNGRGAVNVQYSSGGFLPIAGYLEPKYPNASISLNRAQFGAALACGDFDGNGVDDLAVGAPGTSVGGSVWVLWGKAGQALDSNRYFEFHQNGGSVPGSSEGSFGHALAVGDFGRDGVEDLAVGDPYEINPDSEWSQGTVLIVPGVSGGLSFPGVQQLWGWPVYKDNEVRSQNFGWSLAAGPLVSGGGDDLLVGAPRTAVFTSATASSGMPAAGRVYLFRDHGGLVALQAIDEIEIGDASGQPSVPPLAEADARFGWALAVGDFNGDGKPDAAIGIPSKTASHVAAAGAVVLLAGNAVGLDLATHAYLIQERIGGVSEVADQYGYSLASGNWNADRFDDLAVGVPFEDVDVGPAGSILDAGAVFVHYGDGSMASSNGHILREGSGLTPGTPEWNDWFGLSLASKRLGQVDVEFLAIGIPGKRMPNLNTADCNKAGAVQLAMAWAGAGPVPDPTFLLHQDTAAPYNVADLRECSAVYTPWNFYTGDPAIGGKGGEFFGWAIGR